MRRKQFIYLAMSISLLSLTGCSNKKESSTVEATVLTPTVAAEQATPTTNEGEITPTAEVEQTAPAGEGVTQEPEEQTTNTNQQLIPLKNADYQWDSKELTALLDSGKIVEIANGTELKSDVYDPLKISFEFKKNADNADDYTSYSLTVNDSTVTNETEPLNNKVYMAKLSKTGYYQLIIQEQGYDAYSVLHIFSYDDTDHKLNLIGSVQGTMDTLKICPDGTFTAEKSGRCIETWWYDQSYMISQPSYSADYESHTPEVVVEMEPEMHPMGTQVTTQLDLPILASQSDAKPYTTIPKGTKIVLCSSDDCNWLYVSTQTGAEEGKNFAGYTRLSGMDSVVINGKKVLCTDLFDRLFFAG